jgi:hypothetical protein
MTRLSVIAFAAAMAAAAGPVAAQISQPDQSGVPNANPSDQCATGQVLAANGQSCVPRINTPPPVQSTGVIGQFPSDLLPLPSTAPAPGAGPGANCQPGQALSSTGQPCN